MRAARLTLVAALACGAVLASSDAFAQPHGGGGGGGTTPPSSRDEIALAVGETKTIPAGGVKSYSEGVQGIVSVSLTPDGSQFVITGKKPGSTTLLLIKNDNTQVTFDITVAQRSLDVVEKDVRELVRDILGVKVRRVGNRVFIEGGVSNDSDYKRIQQVPSLYPGQVESLVIQGQGPGERKILIRLDFFFVQYDKTYGYTVGLGWPTTINGVINNQPIVQDSLTYDFVARTTTTAQASVVNQPLPQLDIAANKGWAKVLKQSTVITSNGSEAVFQNGGEQNFLQNVGLTTSLVSVKFGTNVAVLPRFDQNTKDVEIKLAADVADLVPPESGTVPGRNTTKLETLVTLKLGQALILSGIRTQSQRHNIQGLPGLSEIPVLGILFGAHSQANEDTEGAVFIIPSVIDSVPKSALDLVKNAVATYKEFSGEIDQVDSFPKTPPSAPQSK